MPHGSDDWTHADTYTATEAPTTAERAAHAAG
jgi:hypothetical protein